MGKKKHKKQNKTQESSALGGGGGNGDRVTASSSHSSLDLNVLTNGQDHDAQEATAQNNVSEQNQDLGLQAHHQLNDTQHSVISEEEKSQWLEREANLKEIIKQLHIEKYSHIDREAILEESTKELQNEICSHKQKEAKLEMKLVELQSEKESWIEKEAGMKERINNLLDGKASLGLKVVKLEENIKHLEGEKESLIHKENSTKEIIASLNDDVTRLQAQVVELEESKKNLSQENQQLLENISNMRSQIQNLERSTTSARSSNETSEHEDLNSQLEGARALVAKLISENAELVEKVNDLYVELDRQKATVVLSSATGSDLNVETTETMTVSEPAFISSYDNMPKSGEKLETLETILMIDEGTGIDNAYDQQDPTVPNSPKADGSGEIKQVPLDDNEVVEPELLDAPKSSENEEALPLSDAPLIGAPFRLISFVARYVSGADLVQKSSPNPSN